MTMNPKNMELKQRIIQRVDELIKPESILSSTDLKSLASVIRAATAGQLNMLKDTAAKIANAKLQMLYEYMNKDAEQVKALAKEFAGS